MRTLIAIKIVALMASASAFARKASHRHTIRGALKHQSAVNDRGGVPRHPDDVALDRNLSRGARVARFIPAGFS
jgi:hypothetical protein